MAIIKITIDGVLYMEKYSALSKTSAAHREQVQQIRDDLLNSFYLKNPDLKLITLADMI